jgi:DNA/RNA-binding domain of Phe-tRNA-synthetase-like protein
LDVTLTSRETGKRKYQITKGKLSYTAEHDVVRELWRIVNGRGTVITDYSNLWMQIVEACEAYANAHLEEV